MSVSDIKSSLISIVHKLSSKPLLYKAITKVGAKIYPPPFKRADMEFMFGAWTGTSTARGTDGRPLGEDNASPDFYRKPIPTKYHTCNFGDSRDGKFFNMTALHDMMKSWTEVMELYDSLRFFYIQKFDLQRTKLTNIDLFILSKLVVGSSAYLLRSSKYQHQDGNIPGVLAAQNKLITGIFMIMRKMIENGDDQLNDTEPADADALYNYSDEHHILISPRDANYACGGSIKKIKELLEISISGWDKKGYDEQRAQENQSLFDSLDNAFEYGILDLQMELILQYAQTVVLEAIVDDIDQQEPNALREEILCFARTQLPCPYFNPVLFPKQKQHLQTILSKLGLEPIQPENKLTFPEHFESGYLDYLDKVRSFGTSQQNQINQLLKIELIDEISLDKVNKRLGIIPKKIFKSF